MAITQRKTKPQLGFRTTKAMVRKTVHLHPQAHSHCQTRRGTVTLHQSQSRVQMCSVLQHRPSQRQGATTLLHFLCTVPIYLLPGGTQTNQQAPEWLSGIVSHRNGGRDGQVPSHHVVCYLRNVMQLSPVSDIPQVPRTVHGHFSSVSACNIHTLVLHLTSSFASATLISDSQLPPLLPFPVACNDTSQGKCIASASSAPNVLLPPRTVLVFTPCQNQTLAPSECTLAAKS